MMRSTPMHITTLLSPKAIRVRMEAADKRSAITQTLDLLEGSDAVVNLAEVRRVVLEREEVMSTGVGKGLGLPHGKTSSMRGSAAAMAILAHPVDFDAFDGQPVQIVFLLAGPPEAQTIHIRTLSRISRLMNVGAIRERILGAATPEEVYETLDDAETVLLEEEGIA